MGDKRSTDNELTLGMKGWDLNLNYPVEALFYVRYFVFAQCSSIADMLSSRLPVFVCWGLRVTANFI